jgi:hypothetical protein
MCSHAGLVWSAGRPICKYRSSKRASAVRRRGPRTDARRRGADLGRDRAQARQEPSGGHRAVQPLRPTAAPREAGRARPGFWAVRSMATQPLGMERKAVKEFTFGSYNLRAGGLDDGRDDRLRHQLTVLTEVGPDARAFQECTGWRAAGGRALFTAERVLGMRGFVVPSSRHGCDLAVFVRESAGLRVTAGQHEQGHPYRHAVAYIAVATAWPGRRTPDRSAAFALEEAGFTDVGHALTICGRRWGTPTGFAIAGTGCTRRCQRRASCATTS